MTDRIVFIVMPTYNRPLQCKTVVSQLISQTYTKWKLLIIDDGSDALNYTVLRQHVDSVRDPRITLIQNPINLKLPATLNVGLKNFLTDKDSTHFTWVSDDNVLYENFIQTLVSNCTGFCFTAMEFEDTTSVGAKAYKCGRSYTSIQDIMSNFAGMAAFMWDRYAIKRIGFYNEDLFKCEDYDYLIRTYAALDLSNIKYVDTITMRYILHPGSLYSTYEQEIRTMTTQINAAYLDESSEYAKRTSNLIVYYSKTPYTKLFQRPHQIMRFFDKSYRKIFITCESTPDVNYRYENKYGLTIVPYTDPDIRSIIQSYKSVTIYYTDSRLCDEVQAIKNGRDQSTSAVLLFDLIDAPIDEFTVWKPRLADAVNGATFVIYSHPNLIKYLNEINPNRVYHYISNGCDYELFSQAQERIHPRPDDIPQSDKPILGYYGAFAEWLDHGLIKRYADSGLYHILMIGGIPNCKEYNIRFEHPNITWLDHKPYSDIPRYLSWFDACFTPFKSCELNLYTNPCKLWEYMASGKYIYTECNFKSVYSYCSTDIYDTCEKNISFSEYNANSAKMFDYKVLCLVIKSIVDPKRIYLGDAYQQEVIKNYNIHKEFNIYNHISFVNGDKMKILNEKYLFDDSIDKIPITVIFMIANETIDEISNILKIKNMEKVDEILIYVCKNKNNTENRIGEYGFKNIQIFYYNDIQNYSDGRNLLLRNAKNDLILSMDVGNIYPDTYLNDMYATYLAHNSDMVCSMCKNRWEITNENKNIFNVSSANILIKRNIVEKINYYPSKVCKFGEDTLFDCYYYKECNEIIFNKAIDVKWIATDKQQTNLNYRFGNINIGANIDQNNDIIYYQAIHHKISQYKKYNTNLNKIVIINSLVSIDDMDGSKRCTKLAQILNKLGIYVVFNTLFPNLDKIKNNKNNKNNKTFIDVDPFIFSYYYLNNLDYSIIDQYIDSDLDVYVINEAPYPALMEVCRYIKSKNNSTKIIYDIIEKWDSELGWFWYDSKIENKFIEQADKIISPSKTIIEKYPKKYISYIPDDKISDIFGTSVIPSETIRSVRDKILTFIINMAGESERYENTVKNISSMNLNIVRYPAIIGKKIINRKDYINYTDDIYKYNDGQIGCLLSHLDLILQFYFRYDEEYCLVCEDDCEIFNPHNIDIYRIIDDAPCNWEKIRLIYSLDPHIYDKMLEQPTDYVTEYNEWVFSTGCYLLSKKGAKRIVDNFYKNNKWDILNQIKQLESNMGGDDRFPIDKWLFLFDNNYNYKYPIFTYTDIVISSTTDKPENIAWSNTSKNYICEKIKNLTI